jgi:hypothetical protein
MSRPIREIVWSAAATVAAAMVAIGWYLQPPRPAAPPVATEQALCDEARAGASPLRVAALVQQGIAMHSGVAVAAGRYATGQGILTEVRDACASVGA